MQLFLPISAVKAALCAHIFGSTLFACDLLLKRIRPKGPEFFFPTKVLELATKSEKLGASWPPRVLPESRAL